MEIFNNSLIRSLLTVVLLTVILFKVEGQSTAMPEVLLKNSLKEQLNYLDDHTKIYENYRAIREDMFQKLKGNVSDTINQAYGAINRLNGSITVLKHRIDSLGTALAATKTSLVEVTRTKESIRLLGIEVNKTSYNSVMWLIIAGLASILVLGFLIFKRNLYSIHHINKELSDLKEEFETYRKSAREAREKMSMDHFNEIKKLRGG